MGCTILVHIKFCCAVTPFKYSELTALITNLLFLSSSSLACENVEELEAIYFFTLTPIQNVLQTK